MLLSIGLRVRSTASGCRHNTMTRNPRCPERDEREQNRLPTVGRRGYLQSATGVVGLSFGVNAVEATLTDDGKTGSGRRDDIATRFATPNREVQPKFRWWWPHGKVDGDEIQREVDQIADAGFGGVEIADVHHSVSQQGETIDPATYGWGTDAWTTALESALRAAKDRDVTVDVTIGPSWPAAVPSVTPDSDAAAKELVYGRLTVNGGETYFGPVPEPETDADDDVTERELVAVQAARVAAGSSPDDSEVVLDRDSIEDVTDAVQSGTIDWTAPDDGTWVVLGYWERGTGQRPEAGPHTDPPSYVVDHFGRAGTDAIIDFWESNILTPPIRDLLSEVGGAIFEDSLEFEAEMIWTPNAPAEFEQRMGYALDRYLPLLVNKDDDPVFSFGDGSRSDVRRDYWETLTQLFIENHIETLKAWSNDIGMELRAQPYGLRTDAIAKSAALDIPEGESLGFSNNDDFRCLAGGRDMSESRILSEEAGAFRGGAYNTTWEDILRTLNEHYAAGVNQAVLHGFSYADAPGAQWPGFAAFTPYNGWPGYSESWGPRQPTWNHVPDVAGYLARTQYLLQSGTSKVDAAVLRQKGYAGTGFGAPWFTDHGLREGYSYQFLSPPLLARPTATVSDGRLAPDGPGYRVLVVYEDDFTGENTLTVDTAERILAFAREGLPVVVVGEEYRVPGVSRPGENDELDALMEELLGQPTVSQVPAEKDIPDALNELGVEPAARYAERSPLLNAHRAGDGVNYYYLHNSSDSEPVDHAVSFAANVPEGIPYRLDAWTGEIERIATYRRDGRRLTTRVSLDPGESTVVAIGRRNWYADRNGRGLHATSTEVPKLRREGSELIARSTEPGTYATTLSNGRTVETTIGDLPDARTLSEWHLTVEDWRPGDAATDTEIVTRERDLNELRPWTKIDGLADVSGVGTYATTVELGTAWTGDRGAYLNLGEAFDTVRVRVNGEPVPAVDQLDPIVDVGPSLTAGANEIEIEVATTLNNRMRTARPEVYEIMPRQEYGLLGPVELIPYEDRRLRTGPGADG